MNLRLSPPGNHIIRIVIFLIPILTIPLFAANRVTYHVYDWQILKTAHFDIYYDKGNESVARYAASIAEYSHAIISDQMKFELTHVIPIFIYNGHNDFRNTTITYEVLPSGVEGFTEIFKNRVVVPFPGSYEDFRHVIMHELVHAFQYNVFYGDFWESLFMRPFLFSAPLWFMEGLAEYFSLGKDKATDMIIRDAVLNKMMPTLMELDNLGSLPPYKYYFVYKGGQDFFNYIADKYGPEKVGELLKHFRLSRDMNASLNSVVGKGLESLSKEWSLFLEKKYLPDIAYKEIWDSQFKFLTHHFDDGSFRNTKPVFSKDGQNVFFFTDGKLVNEIVSVDLKEPEFRKTVIRGTTSTKFEELHSEVNKLCISSNGRFLLFVSTSGAQDRLNIYDLKKKKIHKVLSPGMDRIFSGAFSPDSSQIVFSGTKKGKTDLYVIRIEDGSMVRLFEDEFFDGQPFWAVDDKIYFVSNRDKSIWADQYDIFCIFPDGTGLSKVIFSPHLKSSPEVSPDGKKMAYVSYVNGIPNIFLHDLKDASEKQLTDVIGGAMDPSWSPKSDKLVFAFYNKVGQDICILDLTNAPVISHPLKTLFSSATNYFQSLPQSIYSPASDRMDKAKCRFSPDFVNMYLGYSDYSQFLGSVYFEGSDMIGSHRVQVDGNFYTKQNDLNFNFFYLYQKFRMNIGVGAYNKKDYYINWIDSYTNYDIYFKRRTGALLNASYPFSRYSGFSIRNTYMNYEEKYDKGTSENIYSDSYIFSLGYEYNNLLFNGNYFIKGSYFSLWYDFAPKVTAYFWEFQRIYLDARHFFPLSRTSAIAARLTFASIVGKDAIHQPFYIGGLDSIRGYNYDVFKGLNMTLVKFEYRFPFIDAIRFSWPIPLLLRNMTGVLFWDFGSVWDNPTTTLFARYSKDILYLDSIKSGLGIGIRMNFFNYMKIIFDYATPYDGHSILPLEKWRSYLSIGYDF